MIHEHRSTDAAGRPVLVRRGDDDGDRARLRHEARMLELARHPGVVEIVSSDPDGAGLVLSLPSTETLTSLATQPGLALEVLAAAGETLADLHGLGIVHAGLTAEAILVGPDRRPTLARFDRAGEAGEAVDGGDALRPSDDVAALAKLVTATLTGRGGSRPRRGAAAGAHRGREGGELTRLLRATSEGRIPTARRLARAIEDELPDRLVQAPLPRRHPDETSSAQGEAPPEDGPAPAPDPFARLRPTDAPASRRRAPRVLTVAAAVAGVAAIIWGGLSLAAGSAVERAPGRLAPSPRSRRRADDHCDHGVGRHATGCSGGGRPRGPRDHRRHPLPGRGAG